MILREIKKDLQKTVSALGFESIDPDLIGADIIVSISKNPEFGDYSSNIALQLAKQKSKNDLHSPMEIANEISKRLEKKSYLDKIEIAPPGFLNFFIKDKDLINGLEKAGVVEKNYKQQKILIEYGHVNLLKEIHIGHLRTFILGESLARILESVGHQVFRANYQGDIGLHIAKAVWGIKKIGLPTKKMSPQEKAKFMGQAYAEGNNNYDQHPGIKREIDEINTALYKGSDKKLINLYKIAREWSLEYFEPIYKLLGIDYNRCFFESEVFEEGLKLVEENTGKIFIKDDGAVIFPGEKYGLHNRVFISSAGNPTYEAKDIGLAKVEYKAFEYDQSVHVVASEQEGYFQVIIKAIEFVFPYLKDKKYHLSYGLVDLKEGKMSSRTGNVVTINDLVGVVTEKTREIMKNTRTKVDQELVKEIALGAIKYTYLKYSPAMNMVFDLEQSVSLQGDSGPYLQYTFARIQSLLGKADYRVKTVKKETVRLNTSERELVVWISYFQDTVEQAVASLHSNYIATYLLDLASKYNLFYQENRIIGSEQENQRLAISEAVSKILKRGLYLMGISAPERM